MARLTFWFEFASTYSYLSAMRIEALCQAAGVSLVWRPFLLGPIFADQGWSTSPFNIYPTKGAYMWRDLERRAARQNLPDIRAPETFPQNGLLAARVATLGAAEPWGPAFIRSVFHAQFASGANIASPDVLGGLLADIGQPADRILDMARTDQSLKDQLRAATDVARQTGLFGAPSFTTEDGELFWGDDRLEEAIEWACRPANT